MKLSTTQNKAVWNSQQLLLGRTTWARPWFSGLQNVRSREQFSRVRVSCTRISCEEVSSGIFDAVGVERCKKKACDQQSKVFFGTEACSEFLQSRIWTVHFRFYRTFKTWRLVHSMHLESTEFFYTNCPSLWTAKWSMWILVLIMTVPQIESFARPSFFASLKLMSRFYYMSVYKCEFSEWFDEECLRPLHGLAL